MPGLTDDRGVLKETLKKSPPYKQSPQEGDFVSCTSVSQDIYRKAFFSSKAL